ncbi:secretory immunoglobulin A-binding protein EsiB-like isoform X1 [Ostrea edulis]|uniref:secretory immunoglobulin A-binding protein EsiB-like isoform X1 n=1 Tax=Ostrea edulis TaxID=37623 RepID=UPI0024AF536B|nr:secretory immunoglobulin A-binding protein EsiB-like isoform X1 [Ostrea edulis]
MHCHDRVQDWTKQDGRRHFQTKAVVLISTLSFALYFNVTYGYAWLGYPSANHQIGQRYLHEKGVEKHILKAMEHFKKAADQGHPHAAYNLAIGHLKGYKSGLKPGEAHMLIQHAASKGVKEAHQVLNEVCSRGGCKN